MIGVIGSCIMVIPGSKTISNSKDVEINPVRALINSSRSRQVDDLAHQEDASIAAIGQRRRNRGALTQREYNHN